VYGCMKEESWHKDVPYFLVILLFLGLFFKLMLIIDNMINE